MLSSVKNSWLWGVLMALGITKAKKQDSCERLCGAPEETTFVAPSLKTKIILHEHARFGGTAFRAVTFSGLIFFCRVFAIHASPLRVR
jgi:hypothetical protein